MFYRYLVLWYDGNNSRASIVDDDMSGPKLPYGTTPAMIADDCESVDAIILCADAPSVPHVVLRGDEEITWPPQASDLPTEFRVIHQGDGGIETDADDEAARQERGTGDESYDASGD